MTGLASRKVSGIFASRLEGFVKHMGARDPKGLVARLTYREVLLELKPMNAIGLLRARTTLKKGHAARDRRDWAGAAAIYREALDVAPGLAGVWMQYGHCLKESGNLAAAGDAYDRALALRPWRADTHLQIGHLRKMKGDIDGAASHYARALEIDPGLSDAARELRALGRTVDSVIVDDSHRAHRAGGGHSDLEAKVDAIADQINRFLEHVSATRALAFEVAKLKSAVSELQSGGMSAGGKPTSTHPHVTEPIGREVIARLDKLEAQISELTADTAKRRGPG